MEAINRRLLPMIVFRDNDLIEYIRVLGQPLLHSFVAIILRVPARLTLPLHSHSNLTELSLLYNITVIFSAFFLNYLKF